MESTREGFIGAYSGGVPEQKEDVPFDSRDSLYDFGHGLNYPVEVLDMK